MAALAVDRYLAHQGPHRASHLPIHPPESTHIVRRTLQPLRSPPAYHTCEEKSPPPRGEASKSRYKLTQAFLGHGRNPSHRTQSLSHVTQPTPRLDILALQHPQRVELCHHHQCHHAGFYRTGTGVFHHSHHDTRELVERDWLLRPFDRIGISRQRKGLKLPFC